MKKSEKKGLISRLYPLVKVETGFVIILISLLAHDYRAGYFAVFPFMLFVALIDGRFFSYAKKMIMGILIMFIFMFLIKGLFDPSTEVLWSIGPLVFKKAGVESALMLTSTILSLASVILMFFETTELEDLMISLQEIGVSHVHSYIILSTLQMIPEFFSKSKIIMQAQRARGIETEGNLFIRTKAFFPTLTPLIISSINDIEDKVVTMEARAFSVDVKKTHLKELKTSTKDYVVIALSIIALIAFIIWRFVL